MNNVVLADSQLGALPNVVYRYLREREHAEAFVRGDIWISTLDHIRHCDESRADPHEATVTDHVVTFNDRMPVSETTVIAQRLSGSVGGQFDPSRIHISNIAFAQQHPNALVLCTTQQRSDYMSRTFGTHCLEISEPGRFFELLSHCIAQQFGSVQSRFMPMQYDGRERVGSAGPQTHIAFMSVSGNVEEQEARMLWCPADASQVRGILVSCPAAGELCRIV